MVLFVGESEASDNKAPAGIVAFVMPSLTGAINCRSRVRELKAIVAFVWCYLASPLLVRVMD